MTLDEAKNILINRGFVEINGDQVFDGNKWRNAIAVISKWLEQQPCEDCISRQTLKRKLQEHHDFFVHAYNGFSNMSQNVKSRVDEITNCIAMVANEPSVTPKEKTGRWIDNHTTCDCCGWQMIDDVMESPNMVFFLFCPNCGAKMVEPQESENKEGK